MSYVPYLIANYSTGLDKKLQPWLIPDDAQEQLYDGYVYRGTMSKREGYKYYATGEREDAPYRESRVIHTLSAVTPTTGAINGTNDTFTFAANTQIARGSVVITGNSPAQTATDDGLGVLSGDGTGTVDYLTGSISVTFTTPPDNASDVELEYSFMPGNPVMMIANYITSSNIKELVVADTEYVNVYDSTLNILEDISPASAYTGSKFDFFTWVNYASETFTSRLLFSNNVNVIQQYDGSTVTDYSYTMETSDPSPVAVTTLTCLLMFEVKDRLVLLRTTENGTVYPQRIRISGTGANSDDFSTSATGAGFLDIPDGTWIQGADFNRDDLIIFTEASTWVLKYTGNDTTPFVINKIDESRGSDAPFGAITYLNRTSAISKRGLIISDGYRVERQDELIPDFTFNEVDGQVIRLCFAGSVDADRDHYLIYPPQNQTGGSEVSRRILVTNYDEDNYSIYRLPLSCMGTYISAFDVTWDDLGIYTNWKSFGAAYSNWNSFAFNSGSPFSVGGGHKGEIWSLSETEFEDNQVNIYDITVIDSVTIEVTTGWNNYSLNASDPELGADYIFLTGISGMEEVNNKQFPIVSITDENVFRLDVGSGGINANDFTAYISGGTAQRVIPFSALFKKFNPFVEQDKKVRCGWLYMYVNSTGTKLQRSLLIDNATQANPCVITTEVNHNLKTGEQVSFFGVGGMTELNSLEAFVTVISDNSFSLNGVDSTGFTAYTSGGYVNAAEPAKLSIEIITNDNGGETRINNLSSDPYQGNMTNMTFETGSKKWYKVFINQVGKFIQFRFKNTQAGANINIQATMPGFAPLGRLI